MTSTVETFIGKPQINIESILYENELILMQTATAAMGYLLALEEHSLLDNNPFLQKLVKEYGGAVHETRQIMQGYFNAFGTYDPDQGFEPS